MRRGEIQANSKFPDMKALADFVHSKGLKLGIYSSPGAMTCAKYAGSLGHEVQDAQTYAAWGIDYLKYDLCGLRVEMKAAPNPEAAHKIMFDAYVKMRDALRSTGRPIVYSLCQYGEDAVWEWGPEVGRESLADYGGYQRPLFADGGDWVRPGGLGAVCWAWALERSGHAGGGERRDEHGGVQDAHESVGDSGGSAAGGE